MDAVDFERMLRRVVREELSALLQNGAAGEPPRPPEPVRSGSVHPYDLTDRELEQAERLLPEPERPILRMRVMAYRLERKGNHASASRMRAKADKLEKQSRAA